MRRRKTIYILNHFTFATCATFQRRTRISQRMENAAIAGWSSSRRDTSMDLIV